MNKVIVEWGVLNFRFKEIIFFLVGRCAVFMGPCHHGMAHPQVADGRTASNMEGSCK